ncbi:MAG: glycosyltransferase [Phycisphaeraceae bacterium]
MRRSKAYADSIVLKRYHLGIIRRSSLGLFHGASCFEAYAGSCREPHLVHNVHTSPEDRIDAQRFDMKCLRQRDSAEPLRVIYSGRMAEAKAPLDWVRAVGHARDLGATLNARWLGDGDLYHPTQQLVKDLGLEAVVDLAGYVSDRSVVLNALRDADVMAFCHITPESPRCLLEALISGTPLVGYSGAYAQDLVSGHGGGSLVPVRDWRALGVLLYELSHQRDRLTGLARGAYESGEEFSDEAVFAHRSGLVRRFAGQ